MFTFRCHKFKLQTLIEKKTSTEKSPKSEDFLMVPIQRFKENIWENSDYADWKMCTMRPWKICNSFDITHQEHIRGVGKYGFCAKIYYDSWSGVAPLFGQFWKPGIISARSLSVNQILLGKGTKDLVLRITKKLCTSDSGHHRYISNQHLDNLENCTFPPIFPWIEVPEKSSKEKSFEKKKVKQLSCKS